MFEYIRIVDNKMAADVYNQHFTKLKFDENFKLKRNQIQILNFYKTGRKVVHHWHKMSEIIQNRGEAIMVVW